MLVLTVAIVIAEDIIGSVRLISSNAKRDSNVAIPGADEAVKRAQLGGVIGHAFGEFRGFRADGRARFDAVFLQAPVPAAHFFPALKAADLHIR